MIKEIDVHGLSVSEARKYINQTLKSLSPQIRVVRIIHGYSHGNAIAMMVRKQYRSHPLIERIELSMNQGITDLIIRRSSSC